MKLFFSIICTFYKKKLIVFLIIFFFTFSIAKLAISDNPSNGGNKKWSESNDPSSAKKEKIKSAPARKPDSKTKAPPK